MPARKDGKPYEKRTYRAGKIKCKRCKDVFYREKGTKFMICERCRTHCSRCDRFLDDDTWAKTSKKRGSFWCRFCVAEKAKALTDTDAGKWTQRDNFLSRRYGITSDEYEILLEAQNGVCYICGAEPKGKRLAVDHEHVHRDNHQNPRDTRKRVRGLLCWSCNSAIAKFSDDVVRLRNAADYLEQPWPAQQYLKEKT